MSHKNLTKLKKEYRVARHQAHLADLRLELARLVSQRANLKANLARVKVLRAEL
jgi:hypothetical protein